MPLSPSTTFRMQLFLSQYATSRSYSNKRTAASLQRSSASGVSKQVSSSRLPPPRSASSPRTTQATRQTHLHPTKPSKTTAPDGPGSACSSKRNTPPTPPPGRANRPSVSPTGPGRPRSTSTRGRTGGGSLRGTSRRMSATRPRSPFRCCGMGVSTRRSITLLRSMRALPPGVPMDRGSSFGWRWCPPFWVRCSDRRLKRYL